MKIKEISKKTGLTEKTIRYYEEKGLINPQKNTIRDREFREYKSQDLKDLIMISTLRKLDFGISDILSMKNEPKDIPSIVKRHLERIKEAHKLSSSLLDNLQDMKTQKLADIYELALAIKEPAAALSIPESDLDISFHRLDGLTKRELDLEIKKYGQREKDRLQRSLRISVILFCIIFTLFSGLLALQWGYISYLPYIGAPFSSYNSILPYILLVLSGIGISAVFFMMHKQILSGSDEAVKKGVKKLRLFILILLIYTTAGFFMHSQISQTLKNTKISVSSQIMNQWYPVFRMTHYADTFLYNQELFNDKIGFALYINQICYGYPRADMLRSKTADLLIWAYDICMKEISYASSSTDKEKTLLLFEELNNELAVITRQIVDLPNEQKAELALKDSKTAVMFREKIEDLALEYIKKTEDLFK